MLGCGFCAQSQAEHRGCRYLVRRVAHPKGAAGPDQREVKPGGAASSPQLPRALQNELGRRKQAKAAVEGEIQPGGWEM